MKKYRVNLNKHYLVKEANFKRLVGKEKYLPSTLLDSFLTLL